jgi:hypothetical protein
VITLAGDILAVASRFGLSSGDALYNKTYDRGPRQGPHPWNLTAPDGQININIDIMGAAVQFGHNCA